MIWFAALQSEQAGQTQESKKPQREVIVIVATVSSQAIHVVCRHIDRIVCSDINYVFRGGVLGD